MKQCTVCKQKKNLDCFTKDKSRFDGLNAKCRECDRIHFAKKREKNPESYRRKDKRFYASHADEIKANKKAYRSSNMEKIIARQAVNSALTRGDLVRPSVCESCGKECKPDAHHPDYSKPLHVIWFCRRCHIRTHQAAKQLF